MTDLSETEDLIDGFAEDGTGETEPDFGYTDDFDDDVVTLTHAAFDGDKGNLGVDVRHAIVAIMRDQFITRDTHKREWKALITNRDDVKTHLNNMYLDLELDEVNGVAYKFQVRNQDSTRGFPTLLRALQWNREQTTLLVHLRIVQRHQIGGGAARAIVNATDLQDHFASIRPKTATNHLGDATRLKNAIEFVRKSGLLIETKQAGVYVVSSVLERLLPLPKLQELTVFFSNETGESDD
ncbi:DUF4194 domain-containing protein [Agromyces sp. LHK192]|uniref:DUF4194 domain-containing protein n=1 Tax=Agromyces sp. LHK192 TaxID=2498704 RepID=UPI000FD75C13|nr:DUF4194 domain-containing protein [Agromyces sp. LHK192]